MLSPIFDRFVNKSPISVMARGIAEKVLNQEQMDAWFNRTAEKQYTKDLLFSTVFEIMSQVVFCQQPSVNAAYQFYDDEVGVSITSLYNKINGIEISTSAEMVRYAASELTPVIEQLGGTRSPLLPGLRVKLLDGNCIEASEHRIHELRFLSAGALPGKSLVVYDPILRIPIDVFPCEDGHAQERSLLPDVLATVEQNDVWIGDRNFCTRALICIINGKGAFFIIREHKKLPWKPAGKEKYKGKVETGRVYEQPIEVIDEDGNRHIFRRIRVLLKKETRDGDKEICIIVNLSKSVASAKKIARMYRDRWTIETAFQELKLYLNSEINTLGYPPAALFGFCVALVSYMIVSLMKTALCSVHGISKIENEVSGYYIALELSNTYRGMMIAIPHDDWVVFQEMTLTELVDLLKKLAGNVKLSTFRKHPRGPKKPPPERNSDPKTPHVSTARILAMRIKGK